MYSWLNDGVVTVRREESSSWIDLSPKEVRFPDLTCDMLLCPDDILSLDFGHQFIVDDRSRIR
jgi:hypothetical protein